MLWVQIFTIALGLTLLALSSRFAVGALIRISRHYAVPEFIISFLLVGVVAILPELSIGINSALSGSPNFGLGIVFGSNIADLTLIIGLVALAAKGLKVHDYLLKNAPFFILAVSLPVLLLIDGQISRADGVILIGGFLAYVYMMLSDRSRWPHTHSAQKNAHIPFQLVVLVVSIAVLFFSGDVVTSAAQSISSILVLPIFFIGAIVAVGTCLPELNFAIQAAKKKHGDLGVGDILGNVFADCMLTIGIIAVINPITPEIPSLALLSGLFMVVSMAIAVSLLRAGKISKNHGMLLVVIYFFFIAMQFWAEKILVAQ